MIRWLLAMLHRRHDHEPRAVRLVLALPTPMPTFKDQWLNGRATMHGECVTCRGPWEACARGCITRRPVPMPVPGPGMPRSG